MKHLLTSAVAVAWSQECVRALGAARDQLNAANVFPVADSDTGTNLWLTAQGGLEALNAVNRDNLLASEVLRIIAFGMLDAARGNSGVILSEYMRGFSTGVNVATNPDAKSVYGLSAESVCAGFMQAAAQASAAVGIPAPGTILTAADRAFAAARRVITDSPAASLDDVVEAAIRGVRMAIGNSPHELSVLREAHVVDAGALGLLIVLESLQRALSGVAGQVLPAVHFAAADWGIEPGGDLGDGDCSVKTDSLSHDAATEPGGEFEVMFAASRTVPPGTTRDGITQLRAALSEIGDSVVVVEAQEDHSIVPTLDRALTERARVHVHTANPIAAFNAAEGWTIRHAVTHSVAEPRHLQTWAILGITHSPGLLGEIARTGGVGLWAQSGFVSDGELRRALVDTKTDSVMVLRGRLNLDPSLKGRVQAIAGELGISVTVPRGSSDAKLAVGLVAAALCIPRTGPASEDRQAHECLAEIETAVTQVRATTWEVGGSQNLTSALETALDGRSDIQQLTLISDEDVPPSEIESLKSDAALRGIDLLDLRSGAPGGTCQLGIE